jgi:hypothetical protein
MGSMFLSTALRRPAKQEGEPNGREDREVAGTDSGNARADSVEENEQTQQLRIIAAKTGVSLSPRSRRS